MLMKKMLFSLPWSLLLALLMLLMALLQAPLEGVLGHIFLAIALAVLVIEFGRSADITPGAFVFDLLGSVAALILVTIMFTLMLTVLNTEISFHYYFGASVILADSLLSPYIGFRTALRNFGLGG